MLKPKLNDALEESARRNVGMKTQEVQTVSSISLNELKYLKENNNALK